MSMTGRSLARFLPYALAFFASLCIMTLELVAARLVARHVGASLHVWTSVIGVVLGGICLGNFLGGRLADRTEVQRIVGPLFALGAALTLSTLWMNTVVGRTPGLEVMPWSLRTLVVVSLNFLVPATVLGLIGPVVAKVAVDQADRTGSAIGDVYFWGAVGSIAGTFLAGFVLIYEFPTSVIVTVVAAALLVPAIGMMGGKPAGFLVLLAAGCLGLGSVAMIDRALPALDLVARTIAPNPLVLAGHLLAVLAGVLGVVRLLAARRPIAPIAPTADEATPEDHRPADSPTRLADLAALAFLISLAFMSLEMVAGRMTTRHLGSSIYGWTSIIGVMLGGLSLGNLIGGKVADVVSSEKQASWLFLVASAMVLLILFLETPPAFLGPELAGSSLLTYVSSMDGVPWALRVLTVVAVMFFLPSITMGTVSPVVTKLAVDRLRRSNRTGTAIGSVYAWGMVGSILGTFLAGFVLIDLLGTKGVLLAISTAMALVATLLGGIGHATWAGIPLGLTFIALAPLPMLQRQGVAWGIRNVSGDPTTENGIAYLDESNYYYIKVESSVVPLPNTSEERDTAEKPPTAVRRTLVLDNLIHGYFILGHPGHIEYDYEYIYAQVARRIAEAKAERLGVEDPTEVPLRALFLGGGSYTFPRYLQHLYPNAHCDVAEIDPAVTKANHAALGLPEDTTITTHWGDARQFVERFQGEEPYDLIFGDAFNDFSVPWHLTTREFNDRLAELLDPHGAYMINIIDVYRADQIAAERALEKAQIDAVAAVFREAGNVQDSAEALARGIRTAWRGEPLGSRFGLIGETVKKSVEGVESRKLRDIDAALRDPIAALDAPFRGDLDQLTEVARDTLARAQAQRDQNASADAIADVLNRKKAAATVEVLRGAGVTRQVEELAEAIVEVWFGGTRTIVNLLEVVNPDADIDQLAQQIDSALMAVETDLKESPALLAHRLSIPADEQLKMTSAQRAEARQPASISRKLRDLGVRQGSEDYAKAIAESLAERAIRGELDTLARQVAEAARAVGSDPAQITRIAAQGVTEARNLGAFLGAWTETATLTFPEIEVFGTDTPGNGFRETFVVVASESPIDLSELGRRPNDPKFEQSGEPFQPEPYGFEHRDALRIRSRSIILTDDYAPVDNLLAPVAATRGSD